MTIAILGASGFIGNNLTEYLLRTTNYKIIAMSRHPIDTFANSKYKKRLTLICVDVLDEAKMVRSLQDVSVVFYFIHALGKADHDFVEKEAREAKAFCKAAKACGVKRVIYLGGLGDDNKKLSKHLTSRQNVGCILRQNLPLVLEFRASIIVGKGSTSFEVVRALVNKLPFMVLPAWANTLTQPIGLSNVLQYLTMAVGVPVKRSETIEIGGPDVMTYKGLMLRYAKFKNKRLHIICISFLPNWPGVIWLYLLIPKKLYVVARHMISSLSNDTVVTSDRSAKLFGEVKSQPIESSFI